MGHSGHRSSLPDPDEDETEEWRESILSVEENHGAIRARHLLLETVRAANSAGVSVGELTQTAYINTIHPEDQHDYPGDLELEKRIHDVIRWNAMMMVLRGSKKDLELGGHISSFASLH